MRGFGSSGYVYVDHVAATPVDPYGREHAYVQVADDVARRITTGEITRKLPAERALADEYGVAYTTVRHAMEVLRDRGMIITIHGRGTFVAGRPED
jgi:DNA-binding GntR family transcriptional regulator